MTLPATGRIAVYTAPNAPFQVQDYPIRAPLPHEALVKVSMSTICRSDIHSYHGHRPSPCPGLLGHEIVGKIVALGEGLTHDMRGDPILSVTALPGVSFLFRETTTFLRCSTFLKSLTALKNMAIWLRPLRRTTMGALQSTAMSCPNRGYCDYQTPCQTQKQRPSIVVWPPWWPSLKRPTFDWAALWSFKV